MPITRGFLGVVFCVSGFMKIFDLVSFQEILIQFNFIPLQLIDFATLLIPSLEVIVGIFLVVGLFNRASALLVTMLLIGFTCTMTYKYFSGEVFDCGCFGSLDILNSISLARIAFNIILIFMALVVYINANKKSDLVEELKIPLLYSIVFVFVLLGPFNHKEKVNAAYTENIKRISFETATKMVATQNAIVFDARTIDRYRKSHFDGGMPLPHDEFLKYFVDYKKMPKDRKILVYCDGEMCNASTWVATKLMKRGFNNVFVINENFQYWQNENIHSHH